MKICGVEIKGSEAIICILSSEDGMMNIPSCRQQRFTVPNAMAAEDLKAFQFSFGKLMEDYQVDHVVIKGRPSKGKFAGGVPGFKMETAIQLLPSLDVRVISTSQIKETLKRFPVTIELIDLGLKKFQQDAFNTAYSFANGKQAIEEQEQNI